MTRTADRLMTLIWSSALSLFWKVLRHTPSALTQPPNVCDAGRLPLTHGNAFQDVINQIPQIDLRCRRHAVCGTQIRNGPGSGSYKVHSL